MQQQTPPEDSNQHENTAAFCNAQVAKEQDRLRKAVEAHLRRRSGIAATHMLSQHDPQAGNSMLSLATADRPEATSIYYEIAPRRVAVHASPSAGPSWRIALRRVGEVSPIIGLDIRGDTIIGRSDPESPVDVNLDNINGASYGVSRQHALLRPTWNSLYLIDLESTNGTRCNGARMGHSTVHVVEQGDTISFGNLTFEVIILWDKPDRFGLPFKNG